MSAIEKARKVARCETPPRFASHTQSSLMKKRTPINLRRKLSSTVKERESRISSGIFKRRSSHRRSQSRSVLALKMILDQHHRATRSLSGCVLTETARQTKQYAGNLLVSLQDNLIKDISWNMVKCTRSPIKLASRIVGRSEKRAEDLNDSLDVMCAVSSVSLQEELKSACDSSDDTVDIANKPQSSEENIQAEFAKSGYEENDTSVLKSDVFQHEENDREPQTLPDCETKTLRNDEIEVLHRRSRHRRPKETDSLDGNNLETQVCQQTTINRKYAQRIWKKRKAKTQDEEADNSASQDSANLKIVKQVDTSQDTRAIADARSARKKAADQRNFSFVNRRAWRPAGIGKYSNVENTESSTQLQKLSRSTEKSGASTKSKDSPVEQVESFNSESTNAPMSASQSKENRDPRDRATKNCEQTAETKEQHDQQKKGVQKRKRWTRKVPNDSGKFEASLRSRWQQWRSFTPRSPMSSNGNEQNYAEPAKICGRRSKPAEVIHTLKKIIDSVSDDGEENVASASKTDVFRGNDSETTQSEIPRNDDLHSAATEDQTIRSFEQPWRSIGTQTELNSLSNIDLGTNFDSRKILKRAQTVATQTLSYNENMVEIGCNTMPYGDICQDAEVSCDLISSSNVKTDTIKDESTSENIVNRAMRSPPRVTRIYDPDDVYDIIFDPDSPYEDSNCHYEIDRASSIRNDIDEFECGTEEVPSDTVIENMRMIYELAAEHARNLHEAVVIYYENLMSREKQNEEIQDDGTSRDRLERCAFFTSSVSVEETKSEYDGERFVTSDNDFDEYSVCSSSSSSSQETFVSVIRNPRADHTEIDRAEGSKNVVARSNLNVSNLDVESVKSMMRLLICRAQEERAFEILRSGGDDEKNVEMRKRVEMAEKPSIISRENLLPFICCALCTLVFWCLPFSFRCHLDA